MYCRKCGKELEEGSQFCRHCGTPVIVPPTMKEKVSSVPAPTPEAISAAEGSEKSVQAEPENESGVDPVQDVQPEQTEGKAEKKKGTGKKIIKWFFRLLLIAVLALVFVGALFNGNFDGILKLHRRTGFWSISKWSTGYVPNKDYIWMDLNKDGTGTLNMGWGDIRNVKWYDGFQSGQFDIDGQKTSISYSGLDDSFYLKIDGYAIKFYKTEKPEPCDEISLVKAEVTEDINGHPALRVYYNWTNMTDHKQAAVCNQGHPWYIMHLGQPGGYKELVQVSEEHMVLEDTNYLKAIAPGETICLSSVCSYNPKEDAVVMLHRIDGCSTFKCDVYLHKEEVFSGWDIQYRQQTTARIAKESLQITESVENFKLDHDGLEEREDPLG